MRFLGNVLAVIVGLLIFSVMSFFILAGILAVISSAEDEIDIKENTVLVLNLEGRILTERSSEDDPDFSSFGLFGGIPTIGLTNLKRAVQTATENENVKGIFLKAGTFTAGQAGMKEFRDELVKFKNSGKFIVSYGEYYTEGGYYLSSVADEVYVNPSGAMEFNGFAAEVMFFKGLLEKIEVEPQIFRVGDFKSAVEPFMLEKMSDESRLQTESLLGDLNKTLLEEVGESRGISFEQISEINSKMLVRKTKDAVEHKLVDALWYEDQVINLLKEKLGLKEEDNINTVNINRINKSAKTKNRLSKNRIAVIIAEGEIMGGKLEGTIGSEQFKEEIKKARKNKDIKAIVLRVNSPGGSALASEVIWREMEEAKKEKPIIASMGEVAASGGYYIVAGADTIVAQPNTITGSIGIFGLWFNAQGLLNNKLGITTDVVKTGEYSDFLSPTRKITEMEKSVFQGQVEEGYDVFLTRVADGRNKSKEDVMKVASGRVWTGNQALENGLVDVLGSLEDAIAIAAEKASVSDDYRVVYYPQEKPWFERILNQFSNDVQVFYQQQKLGSFYPIYEQIENVKKHQGIMVRMPFDIVIQ
ncbi:protease-4 [Aquiflexum balticum DSM 16537]|uniref:Protease-4 n=1 Tax=Aquiflexum balticum DSM 16537 TaxID=758820 RepID=A0A1W2H404_9BACT|nr:signal peptide peptidase SppA [Aquiflexum balticum]SMD43631.1 protease-4 [Aquiflexum balticum DSM 16537]